MEVTACGVWVAHVGSTLLYLYQTSNARQLTTVDCCQPVHTLLTGESLFFTMMGIGCLELKNFWPLGVFLSTKGAR